PLGEGGIGIIAVWGSGATSVLGNLFRGTKVGATELPPGRIAHGTVRRGEQVLDEVLLARTEPPHEGVEPPCFELNCHGGVAAVRAVMRRLEEAGARRTAWPGPAPGGLPALSEEGIRARAMAALPRAQTRLGAAMLLHQAGGALHAETERIASLQENNRTKEARKRLRALLGTVPLGRALLEPPRVALLGPPNAGKSTLFNALLEQERVIVHHEPGTTRDVVRETVSVRGVPFELMDAAGIGEAADDLEAEAMRRARALAAECDMALVVFDARNGPPAAILREVASVRRVLVANKADLLDGTPAGVADDQAVVLSALEGTGLDELEEALLAPYAAALPACRAGDAVVFGDELRDALQHMTHAPGTK
ncbi:MAG: GTPase, partial [Candidatus Brocadiia bacterium]